MYNYQTLNKLALLIEYDGSRYSGWQKQKNAESIQGTLERALLRITDLPLEVIGSGRTDSGVHASGQVAHVVIPEEFPLELNQAYKAINSVLPKDIRVVESAIGDSDFHARYRAFNREYVYSLRRGESVFHRNFTWQVLSTFKPELLVETAKIFVGSHDFTSYSKFNDDTESYVCNVDTCEWTQTNDDEWKLRIRSNRFVYGMVRSLVGVMMEVARGKRGFEEVAAKFFAKDRSKGSFLAPSIGLVLRRVYYPIDPFEKYWQEMDGKAN